MGKQKTKVVRLFMGKRLGGGNDAKKLAKFKADGWEVISEVADQTWTGQNNGYITYTLSK
ncbi:hypothetical protein [Propionimicrobium sp. PCR01-08-3]|uniref:hypothetical protein n=1 Tax=Propionimicrobium sp. PCR01-08-3 TaxID=3052086 RepID=UPI00255C595A|nr:hypothetical protein [Propionimicrobium sp. PCR01-08-3]WIY84336.1 hypothetical protein QQ658_15100 [Propionimicrobium sp. PCR01-08-3]